MGIAHIAVNFCLGGHGSNRVQYNGINGAGTHQCFCNFECLFAAVRLRDQQLIDVDAKRLGIDRIQGVFHVNKGNLSAFFLCFCNDVQGNGCLTGAFRAVQFHDSASWNTANSERHIQGNGTGRNGIHLHVGVAAEPHNRSLAIYFFQMCNGALQCLFLFICGGWQNGPGRFLFQFFCHMQSFLESACPATSRTIPLPSCFWVRWVRPACRSRSVTGASCPFPIS